MTGTALRRPRARVAGAAALALLLAADPLAPAQADPPPWAPAHGYRAKKHRHFDDDAPRYAVYAMPYGIDRGRCDRGLVSKEVLGGVIGGAAGGLAGAQIGKGSGRTAATIGGAIVGVLVGSAVGRTMDAVDQNCVGRILEYAPDRRAVAWSNAAAHDYAVMPMRTFERAGLYCREYQASATVAGQRQQVYGTACRQPDGAWKIVE